MKNILIGICTLCLVQSAFAQKDIYLKINHKLATSTLAFNQTASNNIGNDFQVTRLQYYISDIVLYHDGTQTTVSNKFILVDASIATNELLGNFNVQNLDSISFGIGVGPNENHLDPSTYNAAHPLAPKSPSMHWGWTAGYRFIAFEGVTGATMSDVFQMHSLGDSNYKIKMIPTNGSANGNDLDVELNADYTEALRDVNISGGVISHGETGVARTIIDNFNAYVFSSASTMVPITRIQNMELTLYPNPVQSGNQIIVELEDAEEYSILIYDFTGKLYQSHYSISKQQQITLQDEGLFLLSILKEGEIVHSQKITVYE